ncbi:MAG TPA: YXWGXW repeat-containing protein [Alphaproteobacteria bacterium]|jgi:hypothetical protein|nr:YXWGXW repeat-containing protein [Alphaproteobacteria bacterium]
MRLSPYVIAGMLGLAVATPSYEASAAVAVGIGITVPVAPPALPVYAQPPIPGPGYIWTPGYWAYNAVGGYYWVPGTWVRPPAVGVLWTPPYWGFVDGVYTFHAGYWGPHVGFYGGINYGFGYGGVGFEGGFWQGGVFSYNRSVTNIGNTHITNVYNKTVVNSRPGGAAFNGAGGVQARPTPAEEAAAKEPHQERTAEQTRHFEAAKDDPSLRASANHGKPAIAATAKAGELKGNGAVAAKAAGSAAVRSAAIHTPHQHAATRGTGEAAHSHGHAPVAAKPETGREAAHRVPRESPATRARAAGAEHAAARRNARVPAAPQRAAEHAAHPRATRA